MKRILSTFAFIVIAALIPLASNAQNANTSNAISAKDKARIEYELKLQQRDLKYRDSIDYTLDDGKMSKAEMLEEAEYVYGLCANNPYQSTYFDCRCFSGSFLKIREKEGPMSLQSDILYRLTNTKEAKCANTERIASEAYANCMTYNQTFREMATDHEDVCHCAANKSALDFKKKPKLDPSYISGLNVRALKTCIDPVTRTKVKKSEAPAPIRSAH